MTEYVMRLISFHSHHPEIIRSILGSPTLNKLIFPAMLYIELDNPLLLNSPQQLNLSTLPQEFRSDNGFSFSLYGKNGIELYTTIGEVSKNTPNVVGLKFQSEQFQKNIISLSTLEQIFKEVVPIFQVDMGSVYDRKASRRINPIYQSQEDLPMSKRYFEDSMGRHLTFEIHWINYFGKYALDSLGHERFAALRTYSKKYELHGGIMLILQSSPYDDNDVEHYQRQAQVEAELGFGEGSGADIAFSDK